MIFTLTGGKFMVTLTILAFVFIVGVLIVILSIAAEGMIIFPIIDIAVAIAIISFFVRVLSPKRK